MSLPMAIALYFIIWWTVLFAVLPFGVRTQDEDDDVVPGTPASAPTAPRLLRVVVLNTLVAAVVFAIVWTVIVYRLVSIESLSFI